MIGSLIQVIEGGEMTENLIQVVEGGEMTENLITGEIRNETTLIIEEIRKGMVGMYKRLWFVTLKVLLSVLSVLTMYQGV